MRSDLVRFDFVRPDWNTLAGEWRALEAAADGSFFQSWTWVGCQARQRFTDPWLLRAIVGDRVVGLALFNRTGIPWARTLRLHETGSRARDSVFIEHNGPLVARDRPDLLRPMLQAALRHGRLVLNGIGEDVLAQARAAAAQAGRCHVAVSRAAPFASLQDPAAMAGGGTWLTRLGASTRYHLRRSRRRYEALGPLMVERAADVAEGLAFLAALAILHQASWVARGRPGAFAEPEFTVFHQALIATGLPRGEVELLRISAVGSSGPVVVGYLYNLCWRDRVYAYQSGFDYAAAGPHQTPGLTCHHLAIEAASASGYRLYDFLAGEARYKTSLGDGQVMMHWVELVGTGTTYDVLRRAEASVQNASHFASRRMPAPRQAGTTAQVARVARTRESMVPDKSTFSPGRSGSAQRTAPADALASTRQRLGWPAAAALIGVLSLMGWALIAYVAHQMFWG